MSTFNTDALDTRSIATTRWRIDPARSGIEFRTKGFWGLVTVSGHFARYHGTLDLAAQPAIELTIEADSLDTNNEKRDKHLRSPAFFDAEQHPYVRFVSDRATLAGERLNVRGRLYARGQSMPLELEATLRGVGDELEIEAASEADHRELGMTWSPLGVIRSPSTLMVTGRLVSAAASDPAAA